MEPIIRSSAPSKLDQAPFQTECLIYLDGHVWDVYVQYSKNEEFPNWEYMGKRIIEEQNNS